MLEMWWNFTKQFPLDLEGQTTEFRCPVCNSEGEADIPYKPVEEREKLNEDLTEPRAGRCRETWRKLLGIDCNNFCR
jgi:hypothetical protein